METPEDHEDDVYVCRQDNWIHGNGGRVGNASSYPAGGFPTWDSTPPSEPLGADAGGAYVGNSVAAQIAGQQDSQGTATFEGTYKGTLDSIAVHLYAFVAPVSTTNYQVFTDQLSLGLWVDGLPMFSGDAAVEGSTSDGGIHGLRFAFTNLYEVLESSGREGNESTIHTIRLTVNGRYAANDSAVFLYDATEVPSGLVFNIEPDALTPYARLDVVPSSDEAIVGTRTLTLIASQAGEPRRLDLTPGTDWALVKLTAGADGAMVPDIVVVDEASWKSGAPLHIGHGSSRLDEEYVSTYVTNVSGGDIRASTTRGFVSRELAVASMPYKDRGNASTTTTFYVGAWEALGPGRGKLAPGEEAALAIFRPGGIIESGTVEINLTSGSAELMLKEGTGSRAVMIGDPDSDGMAVALGNLGAGTSSHTEEVGRGVIGAPDLLCTLCTFRYASPDGRTGEWVGASGVSWLRDLEPEELPPSFAGPPGRWTWDLAGATYGGLAVASSPSRPTAVAWAPIGDDWKLFLL